MTNEKKSKTLTELRLEMQALDAKLWARVRYLSCICMPYDMDDEYKAMTAREIELEGLIAELERKEGTK